MATLGETAVQVGLSYNGVHEVGGNNIGPEVNQFLMSVGLSPGFAWCSAFVYYLFREASRRLGIVNPCPRTAKAVRLFALAESAWRDSNPSPGSIYVLDHGTPGDIAAEWKNNRYTDDGHAGIVVYVNETAADASFDVPATVWAPATTLTIPPGQLLEISGNTNRTGSREGDSVWLKVGPSPEIIHGGTLLGYVCLDRAQQAIVGST